MTRGAGRPASPVARTFRTSQRFVLALMLVLAVLVSQSAPVPAYEIDVHFYLTYVLARLAGLADPEAWLVARADQSLDDNNATTAFTFPLPPRNYREHGRHWHALNVGQAAVMQRFKALQCRADVSETFDRAVRTTCERQISAVSVGGLIALGQFLHYYQDTYAHSRAAELTSGWIPYGATFGHLFQGIQPDLIPNRPMLAQRMALDVFAALKQFAAEHGKMRGSYPSEQQIRDLVDVVGGAYPAFSGLPLERFGKPTYLYGSADLHKVRCALSAYVKRTGILVDAPDVGDVAYRRLTFDEQGAALPVPELTSAAIERIRCTPQK
jgi:hypothetical protein